MPNFTYNRDIPDAPNNPSNDQPPMKINTNSTDDLIDEDHFSFNDNNGGLHKQARIVTRLAIPAALAAGMGTVYTKLFGSSGVSQESGLVYTPDNTGNEYQMTRTISGSFPLFSTITANYNGVGATFFGGWTFLPGGLLFQYGYRNNPTDGLTIPFPIAYFNIPFNIQLTASVDNNATLRTGVLDGSPATTGFRLNITNSGNYKRVYWAAIGK